ncbi:hypothetical protein [Polaribacter sp. R77954]|uniref:hypothetical protein n=1 Tax=Polaribacter sp. R77954 TaxID=3093870 RepID=UPI0037CACF6B
MKKITKLYLALSILMLSISCDVSYLDKEIEDVSWNGEVKIPAGFINYNLSEIFDDLGSSDLSTTSTEEFSFSYSESFSGQNNDSFNVAIDDTTIDNSIESPITNDDLAPLGESFPYTITDEIAPGTPNPLIGSYNRNNQKIHDLQLTQELTEVGFNGGLMSISFKSTIDANINLTVTIPSFTKKSDQSIYTETISINGRNTESISINLENYNADLTNDGTGTGKTVNKVVINVDANFTFAAGNEVDANDAITYEALLSNASYDVIYGDFKQESFNVTANTIDLGDFFDNFNEGDVSFNNVEMAINVTNDYGFPISMDLSSVRAVNANSSINLSYTGTEALPNTIIIDGVENFGDDQKVTNTLLNDSNSNISHLLESKPTSIEFDISGMANPIDDGNPNENFYASVNNGFNAEVAITFDKVSLDKEIEFDGAEDLENFEYLKLLVNVENKTPLTGDIVLEFKNNSGQIVHTESINAFQAANINQSGESDGVPVLSEFEIELDQNEINQIIDATLINVRVTLQLPTGRDSVLIKGSDEISVAVGLEARANITSDN